MKKVGIFYWSRSSGPGRVPFYETTGEHDFAGYIRLEVAKSRTLLGALNEATPRDGESVMNTHYIN